MILLTNAIFWFAWFKMQFNTLYLKLYKIVLKVFCQRKYHVQKAISKYIKEDEIDEIGDKDFDNQDSIMIDPN